MISQVHLLRKSLLIQSTWRWAEGWTTKTRSCYHWGQSISSIKLQQPRKWHLAGESMLSLLCLTQVVFCPSQAIHILCLFQDPSPSNLPIHSHLLDARSFLITSFSSHVPCVYSMVSAMCIASPRNIQNLPLKVLLLPRGLPVPVQAELIFPPILACGSPSQPSRHGVILCICLLDEDRSSSRGGFLYSSAPRP